MKITWYRMLWHLRCQIKFNPESIQRMVIYRRHSMQIVTPTATCTSATSTSMASPGTGTTTGSTMTSTPTTPRPSLATHFISLLVSRRESFLLIVVLLVVRSSRRAFFPSHLFLRRELCIFCYLMILFPIKSLEVFLTRQSFY